MRRWEGTIWVEGEPTGDGRLIEHGAIEWELPVPVTRRTEGSYDSDPVGSITKIERHGHGQVHASGHIQDGVIPEGQTAAVAITALLGDWSEDEDRMRLTKGRLGDLFLLPSDQPPSWAICRIHLTEGEE